MIDQKYKNEILAAAREARIKEITEYQVNIDNFRRAVDLIGSEPGLQNFKDQLSDLMKSAMHEQRKAQIMLDVIQAQLE